MKLNRLLATAMIVTTALCLAGCSRKAPKKFVIDELHLDLPATAAPAPGDSWSLPDPAATVLRTGEWSLKMDRHVLMRSNTMATTELTSVTSLILNVVNTANGDSEVVVTDAESTLTAVEEKPDLQDTVKAAYLGLSFTITRTGDGNPKISPLEGREMPTELATTLGVLLPAIPSGLSGREKEWVTVFPRALHLPGAPGSREEVRGKWRFAGISGESALLTGEFASTVTGESAINSIVGKITHGERHGAAFCLIGPRGIDKAVMKESGTFSVELKPRKGKKRLLEQKVTLTAQLQAGRSD